MFEQIATDLQNKSTELHFLQAALNNLELAQVAQEDQKSSWARFTGDAIREFKQRTETLQADITKLTAKQDALYKTCLLYTSPSPRDRQKSRMPSSA